MERRRKSWRMFARKWHKSPHNRFKVLCARCKQSLVLMYHCNKEKQQQQHERQPRSHQKQIVTYRAELRNEDSRTRNLVLDKSIRKLKLILSITLLSLIGASLFATSRAEQQFVTTVTSSTSQVLNSSPTKEQRQQTLKLLADKSFTNRQLAAKTTPPATGTTNKLSQNDQAIRRLASQATNVTLPSTTKLEEEVELSRATTPRRRQRQPRIYKLNTNPLNGKLSLPLRIDISEGLLYRPQNRRPVTGDNKVLGDKLGKSTPVAQTTQAPFGARAQKTAGLIVNGSANDTEACNPEQQEQGSISTSSQTLRLTKAETRPTMIQVPPTLRAGSQLGPSSESSSGEVEELSSGAEIEALERAQPTLIATPATATVSGSPRLGPAAATTTSTTTASSRGANNLISLDEPSTQTVSSPTSNSESNERINSNSILSLIDEYDSKIITNRTKAQLSCDSGEMILRLNFSEPFKGIVYPDHNRLSPCRFFGDGHHNYELRLPLRGCGTRQAAPRVFVNDVIVRFHKALELEEDEVKTLICRYPPPLAPVPLENGGLNLANSSNNNHLFGDRATNNRPTTTTLDQANNGSSEQESQFEFIDSLNGRLGSSNSNSNNDKLPEPGTTGQIETLSENLVVAPPIGQQTHYGQQISPDLTSGSNTLFNNNQNFHTKQLAANKQRPDISSMPEQPTIDIFNQRNSVVSPNSFNLNGFQETHSSIRGGGGGGSGGGQASTNAQSYFERLSSIELLFLISSLMFLVLLALGLVGGYYCFRRQVSQNKQNRASAILRRKHRYLNTLDHRHNHGATLISPPTILQPQSSHKYNLNSQHSQLRFTNPNPNSSQHQTSHSHHLHPPHHHSHYQLPQSHRHYQQHNSTASPSPDSDLSGQNLLDSKTGSLRFNGSYATPENYHHQVPQYSRGANNQLSSRASGYHNHHYTSSSRSRQIPSNVVDPMESATTVGGILIKQPPVVGRRDTNAQNYGYSCAPGQAQDTVISGRQQRHLSPKKIVQYPSNKSHKWPPNFSDTSQAQPHHDGPLLSLSSSGLHQRDVIGDTEVEYSNAPRSVATRSLRFKDLNGSRVASTGASLMPTKYAFVNKARAKLATGGHRVVSGKSQAGGDGYSAAGGESHSQLWRAKSLSAVSKDEMARARWQQQHKVAASGLVMPLGGTLSRHEHSGGRNNYRRRQVAGPGSSFGGSQSILSEERARFEDSRYSSRVAGKGLLMKDAATTVDSTATTTDDESFINDIEEGICERNNNVGELLMHEKPMSSIILKSIEDAYITNFTEIYEQEYMKRDSTRPLALNEWRAMQPRAKINQVPRKGGSINNEIVKQRERDNDEFESSEVAGGKLVSTQTTSDEDDEEQKYQSAGATNLRSLTELDVNFAKSLPTLASTTPVGSPLKPAASVDRLTGADDELGVVGESSRKQRSNSVPEVRDGRGQMEKSSSGRGEYSNNGKVSATKKVATASLVAGSNLETNKQNRPESPDLILSPDYDYNRLEFEPPDEASKSSHNSVSYV